MRLVLYPAIDLKDGACVRLARGAMDRATVYNTDPAAQARGFQAAGFETLHVVDLNGAFEGASVNGEAVRAILDAVSLPVQLGGGIRDREAIDGWLAAGVTRVILGSAAVKNPALVRQAARDHPGRIVVGIDAREGMVAVEGWAEESRLSASALALRLADAGIAAVIYTDISRDGMGEGLNIAATTALAQRSGLPVIASGGFKGLADIAALKQAAAQAPNIQGAIIGRALYDGSLNAEDALKAAA